LLLAPFLNLAVIKVVEIHSALSLESEE